MWKLRGAVYGVLRQGRVSPLGMQMLVGNLVYCFTIMPCLLSVLYRCFAFAMADDEVVRDLPRAVRDELRIVAALLPVLCLYVGEPFHPVLYISDSSLKGYALHRGFVGSEIATDVGGVDERWRFRAEPPAPAAVVGAQTSEFAARHYNQCRSRVVPMHGARMERKRGQT